MKKIKLVLVIFVSMLTFEIYAQQYFNFSIVQPDSLVADAGFDASLLIGNSVVIGGAPIAIGGVSPYSQLWAPGNYLNDSTSANPTATPMYSLEYVLTVIDANNCSSNDTVLINIVTGSAFSWLDMKDNKPLVTYIPEINMVSVCFDNSHFTKDNFDVTLTDIIGNVQHKMLINTYKNPNVYIPVNNTHNVIVVTIKGARSKWVYKFVTSK